MKNIETSPQLAFAREMQKTKLFKSRDGVGFEWVGTHWQCAKVEELEKDAFRFLSLHFPEKTNEKMAASCVATLILASDSLEKPNDKAVIIPTKGGYIRVGKNGNEVLNADPKFAITFMLNCDFDPFATCKKFDAFLAEALPNKEVRDFLQEYAGYTLLSDTRHQLAAWLIGKGNTGKGTCAQIMQALHRETVALSLDGLDGFKLAGLQSASLVCVDETTTRIDEQRIKTLISGDIIQIDRKYRDPLTIRPTAKWIVNGNALPAISDHSTGFWRRWVIFPFNVVPKNKIPLLAESIIETELAGVLNWCLAGLQRLLCREAFPVLPNEMEEAIRVGKQSSNTITEWVEDDGITSSPQAKNSRADVFLRYSNWARSSNVKPIGVQKFWERLREIFPDIPADRTAGREMIGGKRVALVPIFLPTSVI